MVNVPSIGCVLSYFSLDCEPHKLADYYYAGVSQAFSRMTDIDLNDPTAIWNATSVLTPSELTATGTLSAVPAAKMTADHHLHFTVDEVCDVVWEQLPQTKKSSAIKASRMKGAHVAFITGLLLWFASISDQVSDEYIASTVFDVHDIISWVQETKKFTGRLKSLQSHLSLDLHHLFELEVLANRGIGELDWCVEELNRTRPKLALPPLDEVYSHARDLFSDAYNAGKRLTSVTYDEYWSTRWQWATLGSVHSQYYNDIKYISPCHKLKNKFYTLNSMDDISLDYWISRRPSIEAWASYKWEWGKQRAIYGTDLTSYILFDFVMKGCEEFFPSYIPVGKEADAATVALKVAKLKTRGIPMCMDFEDFNSQHSFDSQETVLRAFYDVYGSTMTEDQQKSFYWCLASIRNQVAHNNIARRAPYKTNGAMFSGWRLTTFMNTALNYAYTSIAAKHAGVKIIDRLHNGDDVLLSLETPVDAFKLMKAAKSFGMRVQEKKSNLASVVEFLRVDASTSCGTQYLSRGIATLVHSRTESGPPNDLTAALESMKKRLEEVEMRGMPRVIIEKLLQRQVLTIAKAFRAEPGLIFDVLTTHRCFGGVSDTASHNTELVFKRHAIQTIAELDPATLPGVRSFTNRLYGQFSQYVPYNDILKGVARATQLALSTQKTTLRAEPPLTPAIHKMRLALYRSHRILKKDYTFGLGRLIGSLEKVSASSANLRSLYLALAPGQSIHDWLTVLC